MGKITSYAEDLTPTLDDLILTVNAPGGTPANKKVTLANLQTLLFSGKSGGLSLYGSSLSGEDLKLYSTSHGTKGKIYFGANIYVDETVAYPNLNGLIFSETGVNNLFIGDIPLFIGSNNFFIGFQAGLNNDTTGGGNNGLRNLYIGYQTGIGSTAGVTNTGYDNTIVGPFCLTKNTTGYSNTCFGSNSMSANTTGHNNSCFGFTSLAYNTTGYWNAAFGEDSLMSNTIGNGNAAFGTFCLSANIEGDYNCAFGIYALNTSTVTDYCCAFGYGALRYSTGEGCTAMGYGSLGSNTTGTSNTALGSQALLLNTDGGTNTAIGSSACQSNVSGSRHTVIGYYAGTAVTGFGSTIIGANAGNNLTSGHYNIMISAGRATGLNFPSATDSYQLNIGNLIFGTNLDGEGSTISNGNIGIGTYTFGANSIKVFAIANGTVPSAHVDNEIQIFSVDSSDAASTLGLMLEQAVEDIGVFTASHKIKVKINGTEYWISLDAV